MTDTRPRCAVLVHRYQFNSNPEEPEFADEPCGRLAKSTVHVGNRDVPTCGVHVKALSRDLLR